MCYVTLLCYSILSRHSFTPLCYIDQSRIVLYTAIQLNRSDISHDNYTVSNHNLVCTLHVYSFTSSISCGFPLQVCSCTNICRGCVLYVCSCIDTASLLYITGMLFQESQQLWEDGLLNYVYNWWNWMDSTLIALYLAYYALQILVFYKVNWMDSTLIALYLAYYALQILVFYKVNWMDSTLIALYLAYYALQILVFYKVNWMDSTRVLHGPGLGPRAGPARSPWAGPRQDSMIFCGPGRVRA